VFLVFASLTAMLVATVFFAIDFAFYPQPKQLMSGYLRTHASEFLWVSMPFALFGFVHFCLRQVVRKFAQDYASVRGIHNFSSQLLASLSLVIGCFISAIVLNLPMSLWHAMSFAAMLVLVAFVQDWEIPSRNRFSKLGIRSII
jgi:hypothetical protein